MFYKNLQIALLDRRFRRYKKFSKNFRLLMYYILKKRNRLNMISINYKNFFDDDMLHVSFKKKFNTCYSSRMIYSFNKSFFNFYSKFEYKNYYYYFNANNITNISINSTHYKYILLIYW